MNIEGLMTTLPYMLWGMLGIFTVTAINILVIFILNKCFSDHTEPDEDEE